MVWKADGLDDTDNVRRHIEKVMGAGADGAEGIGDGADSIHDKY